MLAPHHANALHHSYFHSGTHSNNPSELPFLAVGRGGEWGSAAPAEKRVAGFDEGVWMGCGGYGWDVEGMGVGGGGGVGCVLDNRREGFDRRE